MVPFKGWISFRTILNIFILSHGPSFTVPPAEALLLSCPQERMAGLLNQLQVALTASDASEEERASNSRQIIEQWMEKAGTISIGEFLSAHTTPMVGFL